MRVVGARVGLLMPSAHRLMQRRLRPTWTPQLLRWRQLGLLLLLRPILWHLQPG